MTDTPVPLREVVLEIAHGPNDLDGVDGAVRRILASREFVVLVEQRDWAEQHLERCREITSEQKQRVAALTEALERYGNERLVQRVAALEAALRDWLDMEEDGEGLYDLVQRVRALLTNGTFLGSTIRRETSAPIPDMSPDRDG